MNRRMGTKMHEGRVTATTKMREKTPAAVERSSAQIIKPTRRKKSIQKRQIKSRFSRRRPVNNTGQQKRGQGRSQDSNSHKRIRAYSQENRLKTYYCNLTGHQGKFPTKSRVICIPPKTANKQEQSNNPCMKVEVRNACSPECRTENLHPPITERSRVKSPREKQRSKLSAVEKRRYQTVSEYQFIYPGKAMFYCTKESMKQQLRSIYLGPGGRKSLKPAHQPAQMPRYQRDKNKTQRENIKTDATCPVGSESLRSKHPNTTPHRLTSLMHKISKLVLVNEMETGSPSTPAEFPQNPQLQYQPPPSKSSLPSGVLQRQNSSKERKTSPERGHEEQESNSSLSLQSAPGNVLRVSITSSAKPRPLSAKDCCGKALSRKSGGEDNQNGDSSKKEDAAERTLGVNTSSKGGVTHAQSTNAMPASHLFSSKENVTVEAPPKACSNTIQCLAEERQQEPFPVAFSPSSAREEKISRTPAHGSSGQKK